MCVDETTRQNLDRVYEEVQDKDQEAMIKILMRGPLINRDLVRWIRRRMKILANHSQIGELTKMDLNQ